MNTRLAFEDYTALHHRLETLPALEKRDEKDGETEKPQLAFENRPAREMMREEPSRLPEESQRETREEISQLSMQTRPQREMEKFREPEEKVPAMWRSILQLRVLLPYVSRLLPLLENGLTGHSGPSPAQNHALEAVEKSSIEMQNSHRELRIQLQDQAVEFKRVEEQLERLCEATERNTLEQQELIEDLKSVAGTLKLLGWSAVVLLTGVLGAVGYVAFHLKH